MSGSDRLRGSAHVRDDAEATFEIGPRIRRIFDFVADNNTEQIPDLKHRRGQYGEGNYLQLVAHHYDCARCDQHKWNKNEDFET